MTVLHAEPPPDLKSIQPFIQRATDLASRPSPDHDVMQYWCLYYAAQLGIARQNRSTDADIFLMDLIGKLEKQKAALSHNPAVSDESTAQLHIQNFALGVFRIADDEDRAGEADRDTAKKFLASAYFMEILKMEAFGGIPPQIQDKITYAKYKANDIIKAIKENRTPQAGPPVQQVLPSVPATSHSQFDPSSSNTSHLRSNSNLDLAPHNNIKPTTSPPLKNADSSSDLVPKFPATPSSPGTHATGLHPTHTASDLGPKTQAAIQSTLRRQSLSDPNQNSSPFISAPSKFKTTGISAPPHVHIAPPTPASLPPAPRLVGQAPPTVYPSIQPANITPPIKKQTARIDDEIISRASKAARFAVSALTFEDVIEARKRLREALALLGDDDEDT